jgi:nucleoside-diphosphate-sugar epimerase
MKALVTGATGFVGSHLVEVLRRAGHDVTALVRSPAKAAPLARLDVRMAQGDLGNRAALARAAAGQDVVFHVAGLTAARSEREFYQVNRDGAASVVAAASQGGVRRIVLFSSLAAAGPSAPGRPLVGTEAPRPVTQYGRSKLAGEEAIREGAVPWTILRPPMVYGPRDREVLKVFQTAKLGIALVFGDGTQELSAVHGADLADAAVACATAKRAVGQIYYPCHPQTFTSAGFVRAVGAALGRRVRVLPVPLSIGRVALTITGVAARAFGRATILTRDKANEFFQSAWTGDPTRCIGDTGWTPRIALEPGLQETCTWYRSAGWI